MVNIEIDQRHVFKGEPKTIRRWQWNIHQKNTADASNANLDNDDITDLIFINYLVECMTQQNQI